MPWRILLDFYGFFSSWGESDLRIIGASMYGGNQKQNRVPETQGVAFFCTWSTARLQRPASLHTDHPVFGSSHANANVRTSRPHRVNNFRSASFSEPCPLSETVSLHGQIFQTVSVTSFDSYHTKPLLWFLLAGQIPLYRMSELVLVSVVTCSYLSYVITGFLASAGLQLPWT